MSTRAKMLTSLLVLALGFGLLMTIAPAEVPALVNYQSRLLDAEGQPVNGSVQVTVRIYPGEHVVARVPLYQESVGAVSVNNGSYAFQFGRDPQALSAALGHPEAWLEVGINGAVLSPRQRLVAVPYALRSRSADKVAAGSISGEQIADGSIQLADLAQDGALPGQVLQWNGSAWVAAYLASNMEVAGGIGDLGDDSRISPSEMETDVRPDGDVHVIAGEGETSPDPRDEVARPPLEDVTEVQPEDSMTVVLPEDATPGGVEVISLEDAQLAIAGSYCSAYALQAVAQQQENIRLGCALEGDGWNLDYDYHYNWCMRVSRERVEQSTGERNAALESCAGQ